MFAKKSLSIVVELALRYEWVDIEVKLRKKPPNEFLDFDVTVAVMVGVKESVEFSVITVNVESVNEQTPHAVP